MIGLVTSVTFGLECHRLRVTVTMSIIKCGEIMVAAKLVAQRSDVAGEGAPLEAPQEAVLFLPFKSQFRGMHAPPLAFVHLD